VELSSTSSVCREIPASRSGPFFNLAPQDLVEGQGTSTHHLDSLSTRSSSIFFLDLVAQLARSVRSRRRHPSIRVAVHMDPRNGCGFSYPLPSARCSTHDREKFTGRLPTALSVLPFIPDKNEAVDPIGHPPIRVVLLPARSFARVPVLSTPMRVVDKTRNTHSRLWPAAARIVMSSREADRFLVPASGQFQLCLNPLFTFSAVAPASSLPRVEK